MTIVDLQHGDMVKKLAKPGENILLTMTPWRSAIMHHAIGISGEAGELLDAIKKCIIYDKQLDTANVIEELGDIEFYLQGLRMELGITREQTLQHNMRKLAARYPDYKYTNERAQDRADKA